MIVNRRKFIGSAVLLAATPALAASPAPLDLTAAVKAAEKATGGRVGLAVHDTATGRRFSHHGDERFPMASTFKSLLVAAVLARVDAGKDRLDRAIPVRTADILPVSPVSKAHVGGAATVAELAEATIIYSDNAAANLLLPSVGGPAGLTAWLRGIGDNATRLDRTEPSLNEATPGDLRDTTTPAAMAATLRRLALGDALSPGSRAQFVAWLRGNRTGDARLRAGLPAGWQVGDRTGTGARGTSNVIGVMWPPEGRAPLVVTAFLTEGAPAAARRDAALAAVGAAVTGAMG